MIPQFISVFIGELADGFGPFHVIQLQDLWHRDLLTRGLAVDDGISILIVHGDLVLRT